MAYTDTKNDNSVKDRSGTGTYPGKSILFYGVFLTRLCHLTLFTNKVMLSCFGPFIYLLVDYLTLNFGYERLLFKYS